MLSQKNLTQVTKIFIVPLMVSIAILSGTIYSILQHFLELFLIIMLLGLVIPFKLSKTELFLVFIFLLSQIGSFIINDFQIFLLNAKQFGLGVLSLIYFKRNSPKSSFLNFIAYLCVFLVLFEYTIGTFPFNVTPYLSTMKEAYGSRALGVFLDFHYSSFFLSIFFIGYTLKRRMYFIDFLILWMISVKTNVIGYLFQKVSKLPIMNFFFNNTKLLIGMIVSFFLILVIFNQLILEKFESVNYGFVSAYIIIKQIVDPKSFIDAFYIFPQDLLHFLNEKSLFDFPELGGVENMDHGSELTIVRILVQGGFFLGLTYLFVIFKYFKKFTVFLLISLLHYSFILSPLIIYLMATIEFDESE